MNVSTNVARRFLTLISVHFPPTHKYYKIFNKNTIKVSYSCLGSIGLSILRRKNNPHDNIHNIHGNTNSTYRPNTTIPTTTINDTNSSLDRNIDTHSIPETSTNSLNDIAITNTTNMPTTRIGMAPGPITTTNNSITPDPQRSCNCRDRGSCPLNNNCLAKELVYRADVTGVDGYVRTYIGLTGNSFKERFSQHLHSFRNPQRKNSTSLSKYIWLLKDRGVDPIVKWSIAAKASKYKGGRGNCDLCTSEKLCILTLDAHMLNVREETFSPCLHARTFKIESFKNIPPR
jgi:hypothetical protein